MRSYHAGTVVTAPSAADRSLAVSLHRHLDRHGGFTLDGRTLLPMQQGVSVGADPLATLVLPAAAWDDEVVASWVGRHARRRHREGLHLGGWVDAQRGDVWLDLVQVYAEHDRREALLAGLRHHQHAVFDLGARTMVGLAGLTAASVDGLALAQMFGATG